MPHESLRLFFALDCPPQQAAAIAAWRAGLQLPGRAVAASKLHLTLAFLGQVPLPRVVAAQALAANLNAAAFELRLDRLGRFANGLLYLAPSQPPDGLLELAGNLQTGLREAGFNLQDRPFRAHLSLMRRCPELPADVTPSFDWPVDHFALFASEAVAGGRHYRCLQHWPLGRNDRNGGVAT